MADEVEREILTGYRMVIQTAGEGFSDKTEIVDDDPIKLEPEIIVDSLGVAWERYNIGEHDYVEFRQKYIWSRSLQPVMEPNPLLEMLGDPDADPEVRGAFRPREAPEIEAAGGGER